MIMGLYIATEDELSEAVALKLLSQYGSCLIIFQCLRRGGFGYLKSRVRSFCELARHSAVLLITDLDDKPCPISLLNDWFSKDIKPESFIVRVAVREIEAWILADHLGIDRLLGKNVGKLPESPEDLQDPKKTLIQLARKAPKTVREDLVPNRNAKASQGIGYNRTLCEFVKTSWSPEVARKRSDSLNRTIQRIVELNERLSVS